MVMQQKTGRPVQFELLAPARMSMLAWLERRGGTLDDYAFPSRTDHTGHLSTRQYARLVGEWVTGIGLHCEDYGTHSLRRTKASIIYKATGNLRAVQRAQSAASALMWKTHSTSPKARRCSGSGRLLHFPCGKPANPAAVRPKRSFEVASRSLECRRLAKCGSSCSDACCEWKQALQPRLEQLPRHCQRLQNGLAIPDR